MAALMNGERHASLTSFKDRRQLDAAIRIGRTYGLAVEQPRLLRSTRHLVVHFAPSAVVAKIGDAHAERRLAHELAVGVHLAEARAPIAEPHPDIPAVVHTAGNTRVTFWRYYQEENSGDIACSRTAPALRRVHAALASYQGPLADFRTMLMPAGQLLRRASPRLKSRDRDFLLDEEARILPSLARAGFAVKPIHGGPHRLNWIDTGTDVRLIDLETACRGPLEFDAAYLGCNDEFGQPDPDLLDLMRELVSLHVAVSCWIRCEDVPELAWHAAHHLGVLRARALARRQDAAH